MMHPRVGNKDDYLRGPRLVDQRWMADAVCWDADPEMFFPEGRHESRYMLRRAKALYCDRCPVTVQCRTYAVRTGSVGIWGGVLIPLRTRPDGPDENRPVPSEEQMSQMPKRLREPDEEPGWLRTVIRRVNRRGRRG